MQQNKRSTNFKAYNFYHFYTEVVKPVPESLLTKLQAVGPELYQKETPAMVSP